MQDIHNGISATQLDGATWRKSQRSNSQGACVELARLDSATVAMRNSRDPQGTALIYPATADHRTNGGRRVDEGGALRGIRLPGRLTQLGLGNQPADGSVGRARCAGAAGRPASGRARVIAAPRARPLAFSLNACEGTPARSRSRGAAGPDWTRTGPRWQAGRRRH